jgi:hypothetical protein
MKLRDMKPNVRYKVIKGSMDKAFQIGDSVKLCEKSKDILNQNAGGWMYASDLKESGYLDKVFVDVDIEYLVKKIKEKKEQLEKEIDLLSSLLGKEK